jgi:hypothetical protein
MRSWLPSMPTAAGEAGRVTAAEIELTYRPQARGTGIWSTCPPQADPPGRDGHRSWVTEFQDALRADDEHAAEAAAWARHRRAKHRAARAARRSPANLTETGD